LWGGGGRGGGGEVDSEGPNHGNRKRSLGAVGDQKIKNESGNRLAFKGGQKDVQKTRPEVWEGEEKKTVRVKKSVQTHRPVKQRHTGVRKGGGGGTERNIAAAEKVKKRPALRKRTDPDGTALNMSRQEGA